MAIAFRELKSDTGDPLTVTFTTLVSGDLVVFLAGNGGGSDYMEIEDGDSNPATLVTELDNSDELFGSLRVFHYQGGSKVFGYASSGEDPPSEAVLGALAFSGVNVSDVAGGSYSGGFATATGTSTNPNPPSVSMVTGSVSVIGAFSGVHDTSKTLPTGYGNEIDISNDGGNPVSLGMGSKAIVSTGTEDPGTISAWSSGAWIAVTLELLPATASVGRRLVGPGSKLSRMSLVRPGGRPTHQQRPALVGFNRPRLVGFDRRIAA